MVNTYAEKNIVIFSYNKNQTKTEKEYNVIFGRYYETSPDAILYQWSYVMTRRASGVDFNSFHHQFAMINH